MYLRANQSQIINKPINYYYHQLNTIYYTLHTIVGRQTFIVLIILHVGCCWTDLWQSLIHSPTHLLTPQLHTNTL